MTCRSMNSLIKLPENILPTIYLSDSTHVHAPSVLSAAGYCQIESLKMPMAGLPIMCGIANRYLRIIFSCIFRVKDFIACATL